LQDPHPNPLPEGEATNSPTQPSVLSPQSSALAGLRVVELGELVAGPFAARVLADLGGDVLKGELPEGDRARYEGPVPGDRPDRAPLTLPVMIPSYFAALSAAGATMLAVLAQEMSGLGQVVDVSIAECLSTLLIGPAAVRGHYNQRARQRVGHRVPGYWPD